MIDVCDLAKDSTIVMKFMCTTTYSHKVQLRIDVNMYNNHGQK